MKRWALLKSKLKTGKQTEASINEFQGMVLISGRPTPWQWEYEHEDLTGDFSETAFVTFMEEEVLRCRDCSEILVRLTVLQSQFELLHAMAWDRGDDPGGRIRRVRFEENIPLGDRVGARFDFYFKKHGQATLDMPECRFLKYHVPLPHSSSSKSSSKSEKVLVYTREHVLNRKVTAEDIQSHLRHGVDNTGNMRVWDAETLMLHTLLHWRGDAVSAQGWAEHFRNKAVLELGGGMTALCGLGLAAVASHRPSRVVVTDGHPSCARNIGVCVAMNEQRGCFGVRSDENGEDSCAVSAAHLKWDRTDPSALCAVLQSQCTPESIFTVSTQMQTGPGAGRRTTTLFDTAIVCDCLFFKDFHLDLIHVLTACVRPGGVVFLMQPPRAGSMQLFLDRAVQSGCFLEPKIMEDYSPEVLERHIRHTEALTPGYDPDLHFPRLVLLELRS